MAIATVGPTGARPAELPVSPTLAINERAARLKRLGRPVINLGFGEAGLPVIPELRECLGGAAFANAYAPVAGTQAALAAAASWFGRRSVPTEPGQVVFGPGSKSLLWALVAALPGDVVLPRPCWVSYGAQAALAGKQVLQVPAPRNFGGVPDPETLGKVVREARLGGADPGILVVTLPDNPTGTLPSKEIVEQLCAVSEDLGLVVISDEIYRDLAYDPGDLCSPASIAPEAVIVTGGLSKALALGGWRIGFARLPHGRFGEALRRRILGIASETWSALATPMLHVAAWALDDPDPVRDFVARSRHLHAGITSALYRVLRDAGVPCPQPQAAFYLYPDFGPFRDVLRGRNLTDGASMARHLLDAHQVAVLPGEAFGERGSALRLRLATGLLCGSSDEQRWASLHAEDPAALPWIRAGIDQIGSALRSLRDGNRSS